MAELLRVVTLSDAYRPDDGCVYWTWAITDAEDQQIRAILNRPADIERYQTAGELAASNALVDTFETPPLEATDEPR